MKNRENPFTEMMQMDQNQTSKCLKIDQNHTKRTELSKIERTQWPK